MGLSGHRQSVTREDAADAHDAQDAYDAAEQRKQTQEKGSRVAGELRGIAAAVALMAVLTGCGDGDGGVWGGDDKPVHLDSSQMLMALPSKLSAPQGWEGRDPEVKTGSEALEACQEGTETNCAGLVALGNTRFVEKSDSSDKRIKFGLVSFDSPENAGVAMKGAVAQARQDVEGAPPKALNLDIEADAVEAFADTDDASVAIRIDSVLIFMEGDDVKDEAKLKEFAQLQIDRVKKASAGQNPDA